MKENEYVKMEVDWQAVRTEVNRRLGADYAINYLQNVWRGNLKSGKIMDELRKILPSDISGAKP